MFSSLYLYPSSGSLVFLLDGGLTISIDLNEHEQDQLRAMCERFYGERQSTLAETMAKPLPALAHFREV